MNLHVVVHHARLQVVNDTLIDYEYEARRSDVSTGEPVATDIKLTCFDKDGASVQKTLQVFIDDVNEQPVSSERRERLEQRSVQELGQAEESEVESGDVIGEGRGALVAGSQSLTGELFSILH